MTLDKLISSDYELSQFIIDSLEKKKEIDLITLRAINAETNKKRNPLLKENIEADCVMIYDFKTSGSFKVKG